MERLGMPFSDDTILRQLKRDAEVAQRNSEIRVVGIDDWSWRRATSYGTIMVASGPGSDIHRECADNRHQRSDDRTDRFQVTQQIAWTSVLRARRSRG
jgi:hypothetical protein